MSEYLSAAAEALGAPEALVERSANARAEATGGDAEEILKAWAGGEAAPAGTAAPSEPPAEDTTEPATEEAAPEETAPQEAAPQEAPEPQAPEPAAAPVAAAPAEPPILEGRHDRPLMGMAGAAALLLLTLLVGFVAPALPENDDTSVYSSAVPFSESAKDGRDLYRSEGCAECHTQMVRTLVIDAGLGGVTISDSNQVLGTRRHGPDLAHVGSRFESASLLADVLTGAEDHPSYAHLGGDAIDDLAAYLLESR